MVLVRYQILARECVGRATDSSWSRMANPIRKIQSLVQRWMPVTGFHFDRPLVLFQSDDWGRVGLRDQEGLEQLRAGGLNLGERPYDFYTLETAADVGALQAVLKRHHDGSGRSACLGMNFTLANVDFAKA